MGLVTVANNGMLQMGQLVSMPVLISLIGFFTIIILDYYKIPGAIIIAIILATLIDYIFVQHNASTNVAALLTSYDTSTSTSTFLNLSFNKINDMNFMHQNIGIILTFLFVALFDSAGSIMAILHHKYKIKSQQQTSKALLANSIAMVAGSLLGTTQTSPYIESVSGVKAGGRTGLTAITIGVCFLLAIFMSPIAKMVPMYATAPVLLYIACLMLESLAGIEWGELTEAIPAGITIIMIPATFSIADSIGFGIISYCLLKLFCRDTQMKSDAKNKVPLMMWVLSVIFIIFFVTKV